MPYQKTAWQDHYQDPATGEVHQQGTPVDAEHLNKIEQGIFDALEAAAQASETAGGKAPAVHAHDDRYYTEAEINTLLAGKVDADAVQPVAKGGTGADSAAGARQNLGAAATVTYTCTIGTSWTGSGPYTQTVAVAGMLASDNPIADIVLTGTAATDLARLEAWGMVGRITTAAGSITVTCYEDMPAVEMPIQLKVVR